MGIFFKKERDFTLAAASAVPEDNRLTLPQGVLSTTTGHLAPVLFPDLDMSSFPVTVGEAMAVPAVSRAIYIYSSLASRFELSASDNSAPWLAKGYGFTSAKLRIALSIQDLIFFNETLWEVDKDGLGQITEARHVSRDRWTIGTDGLKIDDKVTSPSNVIYFRGLLPGGGFLENGKNSVRQYTSISRTLSARANNPAPITIVAETEPGTGDSTEVAQAMDDLEAIGNSDTRNAQLFQPYGIEFKAFGAPDNANEFMTSARNSVRLDLANFLNINASLLEGSSDGSSDTYNSTLMVQNELLELSIKALSEPLADRLSMDDITGEGIVVTFDYSKFDTNPNNTDKGVVPTPIEEVQP